MLSRKSVWGSAVLAIALPVAVLAQSSSQMPADMGTSCPMMQGGTMMQGQSGMMRGQGAGTMAMMRGDAGNMMQGRGHMMMPQAAGYDAASEVTVTGTVTEVIEPPDGNGLHLMVKTADEAVEVALGPKAFLDDHHYTFGAGDSLTIIGSRSSTHDMATMTNKVMIVARQITKGSETMTLRDENGRPEWAGQGMQHR